MYIISQVSYKLMYSYVCCYSNSSLSSCYVVFLVGYGGKNPGVLSIFYLRRRFLMKCIIILLSLRLTSHLYYAKNLSITYLETILISLKRYLTCRILCCNSSTVSKSSPITPIIDSMSPSYIPISFSIFRDGELI